MNFRRISVLARKELKEIRRDRLFLSLCLVVPVVLMLLFGFGLSFDVENLPLAIVDHDRSAQSRDYASRFADSRYFDYRGTLARENDAEGLIGNGTVRAVIVIPVNFGRDLAAGRAAVVQTIIDGTFPVRAQTVHGYVLAINAQASGEAGLIRASQLTGVSKTALVARAQPILLQVRNLYNQPLLSIWSLVPKLIMVIMMISPPFLTVLGVVREKETGSIFNIYASTVTKGEFLIGKLAPYVGISLINASILFLISITLFAVPFKGDLPFFAVATLFYVVCTTGIGLVVSVFVQTQVAAMIIVAIITIVPAVLYSGVIIPIQSLSQAAALIAHALPAMYYADIATGSFLKGVGIETLWPNLLVLIAYSIALLTIGYLRFSKRPAQ